MKSPIHPITTTMIRAVGGLPATTMNQSEAAPPTNSRAGKKRRGVLCAALFVLPMLTPLSGRAVVLDWNSATWSAGTLTKSFNIDPTHAGNDITITLSLSTGAAFTSNPAVNSTFTGGSDMTNKSLSLLTDFANSGAYVHVKMDFLYAGGVSNAQFSLFDIDNSTNLTWQDQVRNFSGQSINNSTLLPTGVTGSSGNSVTSSPGFTVTGTGNIANNGVGSQNANVNISYGQSYVKSLSFDYGSGPNAPSNPSSQGIGLGGISFTPTATPEINPSAGALLGCFAGILLYGWRRRGNASACASGSLPA
jgi:hypothetical protein